MNVLPEQICSFAFTHSQLFASMLAPTLNHFSLPHLFLFHQQHFKAHFVSSVTVPPFLPLPDSLLPLLSLTCSNQVPQLEVKSLAAPPPCFRPPLPSVSPTKTFATPSSASCLPPSSLPHCCCFSLSFFLLSFYKSLISGIAVLQKWQVMLSYLKIYKMTGLIWNLSFLWLSTPN